ncbi:MAG TPA: toll/interleukin-1 receptor domain-containing protein, partial [Solimonas sp.]|nr:toll/interleukin-1 receptor domain-containing protein [Solimonas sp.]
MKYWAFISYSHQDSAWVEWLHRALETYRVPRRLVGRPLGAETVPRRLFPVFRDRDELPSSAELGGAINEALRQSRNLIVVCSPRSATSRWVNEEIKAFRALGRSDRIFCLIVDGEPHASTRPDIAFSECFAPALREDGFEPIAADARERADGKANARLKLISGLLNVGFDEL